MVYLKRSWISCTSTCYLLATHYPSFAIMPYEQAIETGIFLATLPGMHTRKSQTSPHAEAAPVVLEGPFASTTADPTPNLKRLPRQQERQERRGKRRTLGDEPEPSTLRKGLSESVAASLTVASNMAQKKFHERLHKFMYRKNMRPFFKSLHQMRQVANFSPEQKRQFLLGTALSMHVFTKYSKRAGNLHNQLSGLLFAVVLPFAIPPVVVLGIPLLVLLVPIVALVVAIAALNRSANKILLVHQKRLEERRLFLRQQDAYNNSLLGRSINSMNTSVDSMSNLVGSTFRRRPRAPGKNSTNSSSNGPKGRRARWAARDMRRNTWSPAQSSTHNNAKAKQTKSNEDVTDATHRSVASATATSALTSSIHSTSWDTADESTSKRRPSFISSHSPSLALQSQQQTPQQIDKPFNSTRARRSSFSTSYLLRKQNDKASSSAPSLAPTEKSKQPKSSFMKRASSSLRWSSTKVTTKKLVNVDPIGISSSKSNVDGSRHPSSKPSTSNCSQSTGSNTEDHRRRRSGIMPRQPTKRQVRVLRRVSFAAMNDLSAIRDDLPPVGMSTMNLQVEAR